MGIDGRLITGYLAGYSAGRESSSICRNLLPAHGRRIRRQVKNLETVHCSCRPLSGKPPGAPASHNKSSQSRFPSRGKIDQGIDREVESISMSTTIRARFANGVLEPLEDPRLMRATKSSSGSSHFFGSWARLARRDREWLEEPD